MGKRKQYYTLVKVIYNLGREKDVFPEEFRKQIPHSTASTWRNSSLPEYVGEEFADELKALMNDLHILASPRIEYSRKAFTQLARYVIKFKEVMNPKVLNKLIKDNKETFVEFVENHKHLVSVKLAGRIIGFSSGQYSAWKRSRKACGASIYNLCVRRHKKQLTHTEVQNIVALVKEYTNLGWDLGAIWGKGRKDKKLSCCKSTFYRYCSLLGLTKKKTKKRKKHYDPVRTDKPNEKWHADVTIFKTPDGTKHYLYLIVDNYSRKVLSHRLVTSANAKTMVSNLKQAVANVQSDFTEKIQLIVDGGTENNNHTVEDYLRKLSISISKYVALKDIEHSNSLVETTNKSLKSKFINFRLREIQTNPHTEVARIIDEYNNKIHSSHAFHTPNDVYANPELLSPEAYQKANAAYRGGFEHSTCKTCI